MNKDAMRFMKGICSIVLCLVSASVWSAPGDLDTTFSGDGVQETIGGAGSVIQQADGKLVVAGSSNNDFALARYNNDGSLDTTFSGDGTQTTDVVVFNLDSGNSVIQQSDGKLVVAGTSTPEGSFAGSFALVRYNSDGSLDTTFGVGGKVTTTVRSGGNLGRSVIQQSDGKLVVAGSSIYDGTDYDFAVVRYNSDGSLDTTFGGDGAVVTEIDSDNDDFGQSVIQQADGKLVVAGYSVDATGYQSFELVRYNSNGSLDGTFHGGIVSTVLGAWSLKHNAAYSVIQQVDGKLVVAGCYRLGFALVRYNSDGSLDTTFGAGNGIVATEDTFSDFEFASAYSVIQQADGRLVVTGTADYFNGEDYVVLQRYNSDGSLDSSFGGGGMVISAYYGAGNSIIRQADGKLVVAGGRYGLLLRYESGVTPDTIAPTIPGGLSATANSSAQINLNWTASTDAGGVFVYRVYRDGALLATLGNVTSFSNTGLTPSTSYSYTVSACDVAGNCSAQSATASATTLELDTTAPTVPSGLSATAVSTTQINLSWQASSDAVGVTGYVVYLDGALRATLGKVTSYSDTGLAPSTSYRYEVLACDAAGNCSDRSAAATATTLTPPDTIAPTVPSGLSAMAADSSQIFLSWTASTDNVGVTAYKILRNGSLLTSVSGGVTGFFSAGLTPSTTYSYKVVACDAVGNCSAQSSAVMATTLPPDTDGDGVSDLLDNCSLVSNASQTDTDSDGQGDACDTDDDGDGVADSSDAFPLNAAESMDTDGDGVGDNADDDDDGDGVADSSDAFPLNAAESADTDGDGVGNNVDTDDDNDGVPDVSDVFPLDPSETTDKDGDNLGDNADPLPNDAVNLKRQNGVFAKDKLGAAVAYAGDFNNDGYGDYIIGIPGFDSRAKDAGLAEVISGKDGGVLASINGFTVKDAMGSAVAGNGDIDSDGYGDVVIGAPHAGTLTILYGPDGARRLTIDVGLGRSRFGSALALGDVNGDGHADILVGAPKDDDAEQKRVDAGSVTIFSGSDLSTLKKFYGANAKANAGSSVASGDINRDGQADIIIGAPNDAGALVKNSGSVTIYDLAGNVLLQKFGETAKAQFGKAVASGDVNSDGYDDVLVGAPLDDDLPNARKDAGSITVFSGNGAAILMKKSGAATKAYLGNSVAAGDVNGDGFADIMAGGYAVDETVQPSKALKGYGVVSVWSGNDYTLIRTIGSKLAGKDAFGAAVSTGDINSDGKDDLIIGNPGYDDMSSGKLMKDAGQVTVLSGAVF